MPPIAMSMLASVLYRLLGVLALGCFASCTSPDPKTAPSANPERHAWWRGHSAAGSPRLVIHLSKQRVFYYKGGRLVGVSPISSGREGNATRTGTFRITEKDLHHRSSLYGDFVDASGRVVQRDVDSRTDTPPPGTRFLGANMRYFMRVTGAIGMHEGYLPGYPASHGCIRLPSDMAAIFFRETPVGTPVQVIGDASLAVYEPPPTAAPVATRSQSTPATPVSTPPRATATTVVRAASPAERAPGARRGADSPTRTGWPFGSGSKRPPLGTTRYLE